MTATVNTTSTTRAVIKTAVLDTMGFFLGRSRGRMKDNDSSKADSGDSESLSFPKRLSSGSVSSSYSEGIVDDEPGSPRI